MARADHQWMTIRKLVRAAGEGYAYDPGTLQDTLNKAEATSPLSLRMLSVAGGLLSAATFTGFLFLGGLVNEGLPGLALAALFCLASIILPRFRNTLSFDTFSLALQVIGLILGIMALTSLGWSISSMAPLCLGIGLLVIAITRSQLQAFTSVLLAFASGLAWMTDAGWNEGIHLYNLVAITTLVVTLRIEPWAIARRGRVLWMYIPLRNAFVVAAFAGFLLITGSKWGYWSLRWIWISYLPTAAALLYLVRHLTAEVLSAGIRHQRIWMAAALLLTLPTAANPAISGSLLIMLLGFYSGHRSAFVLGILGLPLFIGIWYYQLEITLLQKSLWMMATGLACLGTYFFLVLSNNDDVEG